MKLGFLRQQVARQSQPKSRRPAPKRRRLGFDFLEDRRLLAVTVPGTTFYVPGTSAGVAFTGNHSVAMDAAGNAVVTWIDSQTTDQYGEPTSPYSLDYQLFNNSGTLTAATSGTVASINESASAPQNNDEMVARAPAYGSTSTQGSNFAVAWQTASTNKYGYYVYATHVELYGGNGKALTSPLLVGSDADDSIEGLTMDDTGFDVLYGSHAVIRGAPSSDPTWMVQRFSASGAPEGQPISVAAPYQATSASISMDGKGNFVVAWAGMNSSTSQTYIDAQPYSSTGTAQGSVAQIATTALGFSMNTATDSSDDFVVTWYPGGGRTLVAQTVYANNSLGVQNVVDTSAMHDLADSIAMQPNGNYALSWVDDYGSTSADPYVVNADTFQLSGAAQQPSFTVYETTNPYLEQFTSAASDNAGDLLVTYSGFGSKSNSNGTNTIYTDGGVWGDFMLAGTTPLTAAQFGVSAPANITAGVPFNITVTAEDAKGNTASSFNGNVALTDSYGDSLGSVMLTNGTGTVSVTLSATGSYTLSASGNDPSTGNTITGTSTVNVFAPATQLILSGIPANATAGSAFSVTVTAEAADGSFAQGYSGTVGLTSSDSKAVLPATVALTNGVATFSATLKTAGSQTLTVTDSANRSLTATSGIIAVAAAAASQFIIAAPSSVTSGTPFNVTITAEDAYGNIVVGYAGAIQITSGGNTLAAGSLTDGVGTFSVTLTKTGSPHKSQQQTVTVTSGSITNSFVVTVN